ncbi:MAG TPA: amidohydrolase family protein, partial [Planctomycetota bacterium]|nr:amidohydrolase family protein [Planctomycetota bacterium]
KALTCPWEGPQFVDRAVVLVRDGAIEAVGPAAELAVPEGYAVVDLGARWLMPGMIDLHCHVAGMSLFEVNDLNDLVYLANPGLRAIAAVVPRKDTLVRAVAGGVTSVLYIPGSGSNIGGQGVLLKTGDERFEDMLIRQPGSMKLAQAGNPERWGFQPGRSLQNWNTRHTLRRGIANARARRAVEGDPSAELRFSDPQWDVFGALLAGTTQISAHTQVYQVVLATITIVRQELGLPVYIDHGTIGGWKTGALAHAAGVPAIVGPRAIDTTSLGFQRASAATLPGIRGVAAGYQSLGHDMVGFNTDSPVVPEEELSVQAACGARYGFRDDALQVVRGLTIVPARAAGIDGRVGSLEPGKDADLLVVTGHPADPRTAVLRVWIEGKTVYSAEEGRLW